jgi:hypothetical protein
MTDSGRLQPATRRAAAEPVRQPAWYRVKLTMDFGGKE